MKIAIIGTGNGGCAMAAHLALLGHSVNIYGRNQGIVAELSAHPEITLSGKVEGVGRLNLVTDDLGAAIKDTKLIIIVTTANAHGSLAQSMSAYLEEDQVVILSPGRTGGALEFRKVLDDCQFNKRVYISEAHSLVYACRATSPHSVNILGIKESVPLAAFPSKDTEYVVDLTSQLFDYFIAEDNMLTTSLENFGAILHPSVMILNAGAVSNHNEFYFYRDMSDEVARFIEDLDLERIALGKAFGITLETVADWLSGAYHVLKGDGLKERIQNNPVYDEILAPKNLNSRQLFEDIPTGLVPMYELGKLADVAMPLSKALIDISSSLLSVDFMHTGRTLERLGLGDCESPEDVVRYLDEYAPSLS